MVIIILLASIIITQPPSKASANTDPVAQDDFATIDEDTSLLLDSLVANDTDSDPGDILSIISVDPSSLQGGIVTLNSTTGHVTYVPAENFHGTDNFEYVVSDGNGGSDSATVTIIVNSINDSPTANAGPDQTVYETEFVILDGGASADIDGTIIGFSWEQAAGSSVDIVNSSSSSLSFLAPNVIGTGEVLEFLLTVTDNESATDTAAVSVTVLDLPVPNQPLMADAGPDQSVDEGTLVTLNGTGSTDPEGDPLSYSWVQTAGEPVTLSNANITNPTFTTPNVGSSTVLTFELTVSDGTYQNTDMVNITVDNISGYSSIYSPSFVATGSTKIDTPDRPALRLTQFAAAAWFKTSTNYGGNAMIVNKGGLGSDSPGQNMNYGIWMNSAEKLVAGFEKASNGADIVVTTTATYNDGQWHHAVVTFDGSTVRLYVDGVLKGTKSGSGPEINVFHPLRIGANSNPNGNVNYFKGEIDEVTVWKRMLSSAEVSAYYSSGIMTNTNGLVAYMDGMGINNSPIANAGLDQTVNEGVLVTLDGSASSDPDGDTLSYSWIQTAGPVIALSDATHAIPTFTAPLIDSTELALTFQLKVTDTSGMESIDSVSITVGKVYYTYSPSFLATGSSYFDIADDSSLRLEEFTSAAWFKTSVNYGGNVMILNKGGFGSDSPGQNMNYGLWLDANEKLKGGFETSSGVDKFVTSSKKYNDNKWHHAAVTFDRAAIRIYVDGTQVGSLATTSLPDSKSTKPLRIGANSYTSNNYFKGQLDEVRLWDRALSPTEIVNQFKFGQSNIGDWIMHFDGVKSSALPTAVAGSDQTVIEGSHVILNGSESFDSDASDFIVAYTWTQIAGEPVTLSNNSAPVTDFTAPSINMTAVLKFRLDVYSSNNEWASDKVNIRVLDTDGQDSRPNIIVIMTDDQRWDTMAYMTNVNNIVAEQGLNFTNSFVTTSLCCPSRASFLTGQYAHDHGVIENTLPYGGVTRLNDTSTLATWLQEAGYTTGLIGKYLNGYGSELSPYIPPGWDDWRVFSTSDSARYYDYNLNENGELVWYGSSEADYSTDVLRDKAINFIQTSERPFFLYLPVYAPHEPTTVAPRHVGTCSNFPLHRPPSLNEADVSDKPNWIKALPLMSASTISNLDSFTKKQMCTLKAVDEAIASIVAELGPEINNTAIVITSDNGYMWGEHRLIKRKSCIYEECQRVPLFIVYPKMIKNPEKVDQLVVNIDLTATIVDLARASPGLELDGKSLVSLMNQTDDSTPVLWPDGILQEYFIRTGYHTAAVRTLEYKYVELGTGEREFYDLTIDPYELKNAINDPAYTTLIEQLRLRLSELKND